MEVIQSGHVVFEVNKPRLPLARPSTLPRGGTAAVAFLCARAKRGHVQAQGSLGSANHQMAVGQQSVPKMETW